MKSNCSKQLPPPFPAHRCFLALISLSILLFSAAGINAQGLTISSGTSLAIGSSTVTLDGDWNNAGTFNEETGKVVFIGSATHEISNSETFYDLTVNMSSGSVRLLDDISVGGAALILAGTLDLNGHNMALGSTGSLSETAGNLATGGTITASADLNAPTSANTGGLGAEITSAANLGTTLITRGSAVQTGGGNVSIKRYYDIAPANNSGLDATLVFHYDQTELNSLPEAKLKLFRSTDDGTNWTGFGGTVNTSENTVTLSGIGSFSRWTAASSDQALPVEVTSFIARTGVGSVTLSWKSQTEINNAGFNIYRQDPGDISFRLIGSYLSSGSLKGAGTSAEGRMYTFTDKKVISGKTYLYKLESVSVYGATREFEVISVLVDVPKNYALYQNYPNPFNPTTTIRFDLKQASEVTLEVYNSLGQRVEYWNYGTMEAGRHDRAIDIGGHSSGVYFYRITAAGEGGEQFVSMKKMLMLK